MAARKSLAIPVANCGIPTYSPVESAAELEFNSDEPRTWRGLPLHSLGERTVVFDGGELVATVHVAGAPVKTEAAGVLVADGPAELAVSLKARTYRDSRSGDREATGQLEVDLFIGGVQVVASEKFLAEQRKRAEAVQNA